MLIGQVARFEPSFGILGCSFGTAMHAHAGVGGDADDDGHGSGGGAAAGGGGGGGGGAGDGGGGGGGHDGVGDLRAHSRRAAARQRLSDVGRLTLRSARDSTARLGVSTARLLLPRKLQAQVAKQLEALDLKAAVAELRSYRDPPDAVRALAP
eukprot:6005500-Pleurochrysis_carterae.AAC.1